MPAKINDYKVVYEQKILKRRSVEIGQKTRKMAGEILFISLPFVESNFFWTKVFQVVIEAE